MGIRDYMHGWMGGSNRTSNAEGIVGAAVVDQDYFRLRKVSRHKFDGFPEGSLDAVSFVVGGDDKRQPWRRSDRLFGT